jgi:tetratricopeptide (TPR) repeat protein
LNQKVRFVKKIIPLLQEAWDEDIAFFNSLSELVYTFLSKNGIYHCLNSSKQQTISDIMKKAGYDPAVFILDQKMTGVYGIYVDTNQPDRGIPFHIQLGVRKRKLNQNTPFRQHTLSQFRNVQNLNFWTERKIHTVQLLYPEFEEPVDEFTRDLKLNFSGDSAELAMFMAILHHLVADESPLKNKKIFATGKIKSDGTILPVNSLPEKMKIIFEEHPDMDLVYLSEQQKDISPENYPNVHIVFAKNISEIWDHWKTHISPAWLNNSIPFLNHEIRFLRQSANFQSGLDWISEEQKRLRMEELICLGMQYIKNSESMDSLPSRALIEQAVFFMNAGYFYNHYGNLLDAEKMYRKFLYLRDTLERRGDITWEMLHGLNQIAIFYRDIYDYEHAIPLLDDVINSKKFFHLPNIEKATWYRSRALIALDRNDFTLAEKLLKQSSKIAQKSQDSIIRQKNLEMELYCKTGNKKKARKLYHQLLNYFLKEPGNSAFSLLYILKYLVCFEDHLAGEVQNTLNDLILEKIRFEHYVQGMIFHWYARWCVKMEKISMAFRLLEKSTRSFRKLNSPDTDLLALGNEWWQADLVSDNYRKKQIETEIFTFSFPSIYQYLKPYKTAPPKFLPDILHF